MEDIAQALKIAGAILIFILAITIAFSVISQAKKTSDIVLYHTDKTNFDNYEDAKNTNREVDIDTVISTLYRYYEESFAVKILDKRTPLGTTGNITKTFDLRIENNFSDIDQIEDDLNTYIKDELLKLNNIQIQEQFDEVVVNGAYKIGTDGSKVIIEDGSTRIYITYIIESN